MDQLNTINGLSIEQAQEKAKELGFNHPIRVASKDGVNVPSRTFFDKNRISVELENEKVVRAFVG
jgi:hypothetical protein